MDEHTADPSGEQQLHGRHYRLSTVLSVLTMAFGTLAFGYSAGVIGTTLGQPSFYTYFGLDTNPHASGLLGATGSLYYVGGFFGAFLGNWMADIWGRKPAILTGCIITVISQALQAGSVNIAMFLVFRTINGFGGIIVMQIVTVWVSECVPSDVRGSLSQLSTQAIPLGYFLAGYIGVGFFFQKSSPTQAWRGPIALGILPSLPLLIGIWWVPESPRYLLMKGRDADATAVVRKLHSRPGDTEHLYAEVELLQMRKQIELDRTLPHTWLDMFRKPTYRKRFFMATYVSFSVMASGSQVIAIYAAVIFKNLGFSPAKQVLLQAGIYAQNWPLSVLCIFYTEKVRRNRMVGTGIGCMTILLAIYTALIATVLDAGNRSGQIVATAMVFLYFAAYSAFLEGPFYYYTPEMFPNHLRAKGMTIMSTVFSVSSIIWSQSGPTAIANIGWRYFLIFIILSTISSNVIFWTFPNTQGKSLEEVAALFGDDDLVVIYQQDIRIDASHHLVVAEEQIAGGKIGVEEKPSEASHIA